jgi:hypothetical protein
MIHVYKQKLEMYIYKENLLAMTRQRGFKDNVAKLRRLTNLLQCGLSDECCWCLGGDAIDFSFLRQSHRLPPPSLH